MRILGTRVDHVNMQEAVQIAANGMREKAPFVVVTPNSEIVVQANKDEKLLEIIEKAGLVVPDGIGLVIASRLVKEPLEERVTGIDLMTQLLSYANGRALRVFLLGGKPGIAETAANRIRDTYEDIVIVDTHHGYFKGMHTGDENSAEEQEVVRLIREQNVDMLFVALGAPKQEFFIDRYKNVLGARLLMGVGGSLDVLSGNVRRAPEFWQKHGLEWLYRIIEDPRARLKRSLALPIFALNVLIRKDKPMK